mmetsp:Transcript_8592/g.19309  ORF Transcript_8592/g.19309 Transcript_8592/m.19309 type:complete len:450 (-) Transcript_8592:138-1487(-)
MKTIAPYRTAVASFSSLTPAKAQQQQGFEYDSGEYILSLASPSSPSHDTSCASSCVAAALSNQSIVLYDTNVGQVTQRIENAHSGPISEIDFFPSEYTGFGNQQSPLLISASHDSTVKVWDVRSSTPNQPAITMKLALPNEQALSVSLGYGGTLAAVGTNKARVSFFDLRYANGNNPSGALMGSYVDAHTEEVTQVSFQTLPQSPSQPSELKTVLATASEDGLIAIHDPSRPSEDDALLSVLNIGAPLRNVGFFGPCYEGIYALTGSETMSVHHWDSAQKVSDVGGGGLRGLLSNAVDTVVSGDNSGGMSDAGNAIDYLVGCTWAQASTASPALHLLAGNSNGDGYLFRMDADQITPLMHLKGGHRGCIRDFCWVDGNDGGGKRLVTGGEDARLCEWDLSGNQVASSGGSGKNPRSHGRGGGQMSGRTVKSASDSSGGHKGKKKFGTPY